MNKPNDSSAKRIGGLLEHLRRNLVKSISVLRQAAEFDTVSSTFPPRKEAPLEKAIYWARLFAKGFRQGAHSLRASLLWLLILPGAPASFLGRRRVRLSAARVAQTEAGSNAYAISSP